MRVLQLHNHHRTKGGAMEVLAQEADLLTNAGHAVQEYTVQPPEQMGISAARAGLKAVWNVEASREVAARISGFRPDVVHVHTPFPLLSPAVFRTASRLGVPAVTTLHSFRYSCIAGTCFRDGGVCEDCVGKRLKYPGVVHRCYHDSLGASTALTLSLGLHRQIGTFHHVAKFMALTEFARKLLVRDGIPAARTLVTPNFVPDPGEPATARPERPYVAYAGRLMRIKGVHTLLDAWAGLGAARDGVRLRIAGDGELRSLVEERADADASIEFLGWLEEREVTDLMAGAACVVVPSEWYEGQPLVVLRSLSVGTPVVVSDLENLSTELLADDAGVAFRVGDARSLEQVLGGLLADAPGLAARRSKARASYRRRYSPTVHLQMLEDVYHAVTSPPAAQAG